MANLRKLLIFIALTVKCFRKPLVLNEKSQHQRQQPIYQADLLLWKRRSRASLRRHTDIRNMAIRELHDTEKTFVETLEYLVQVILRFLLRD